MSNKYIIRALLFVISFYFISNGYINAKSYSYKYREFDEKTSFVKSVTIEENYNYKDMPGIPVIHFKEQAPGYLIESVIDTNFRLITLKYYTNNILFVKARAINAGFEVIVYKEKEEKHIFKNKNEPHIFGFLAALQIDKFDYKKQNNYKIVDYVFPKVPIAGNAVNMGLQFLGDEVLEIGDKKYPSYKVKLYKTGIFGGLAPDFYYWFSKDKNHCLLKYQQVKNKDTQKTIVLIQ